MITESRAREIASWWHSGKSSPLYEFCSTGKTTRPEELLDEIQEICPNPKYTTPGDRRSLSALLRFVERQFKSN